MPYNIAPISRWDHAHTPNSKCLHTIGEVFNLVNWQFCGKLLNLKSANVYTHMGLDIDFKVDNAQNIIVIT
jgi:hypothetical protein